MPDEAHLRSIEIDLATNSLRLMLDDPPLTGAPDVTAETASATIDIGTAGRLVGVELGDDYIDVMAPEPGTEHLIRSAEAPIAIEREGERRRLHALIIPRLGAGYEITWPSGNQ